VVDKVMMRERMHQCRQGKEQEIFLAKDAKAAKENCGRGAITVHDL
jgi:hypothetical protein